MDDRYKRKLSRAMRDVVQALEKDKGVSDIHFKDYREGLSAIEAHLSKVSIAGQKNDMVAQRLEATSAAAKVLRFLVELM